jgi:Ni,Fe-hydrogenase maturation factor
MARTLKDQGVEDVWLESEVEENDGLEADPDGRPFILLDAVDFEEAPGKVTLLPMQIVLQNSSLSHKILPIVSEVLTPRQMRNAYLLGIQAGSLAEGERISPAVRRAMEEVLEQLKN